ncbi:DUF7848 domain-containing protein [Streptomyces daliensis]
MFSTPGTAVTYQAVCLNETCDGNSEESVTAGSVSTWMHAHEVETGHQKFRRLVMDTETIQSPGRPKPVTPVPHCTPEVRK